MPGTLTFRPIEANLARDTDIVGKMNPYCSFSVGATKFSTQVCKKGGKNPQWIDTVSIPINGNEPTAVIEVNDKDTFTKDDSIGTCTINLQQLIREGSVNRWFPLFHGTQRAGDILVEAVVSNGNSQVFNGSNSAYGSTSGTYGQQGAALYGQSGSQQTTGAYETTTQSTYQTQSVPQETYTQSYQTQQALPTQQVYESQYTSTSQALPVQQNYQYSNLNQSQTYVDSRYNHATVPGVPGSYTQSYASEQDRLIQPTGFNFLGLGGIGGLFGRSHNKKNSTKHVSTGHTFPHTQTQNQSYAQGSFAQGSFAQGQTLNQSQTQAYPLAQGYAQSHHLTNAGVTNTGLLNSGFSNTGYSETTTNTVNTNAANTMNNTQLGAYYTGEAGHRYYTEQHEVVEPHAFMKPVQVTEVVPVQRQVEVYEPRRVMKDVMYTQAVPVTRTIDVTEPQVVMREVEVMEPRLVNKTIEVIENVPVTRQVEVVEMRSHMTNVETFEPQTFHKQVEVTENFPVMRNVQVTEPRTYTKAVEFVEPVITTETITKEYQPAVVINERVTQEVGPASVIGIRQDYETRRGVQVVSGERQLNQGFEGMSLNQNERRYEDEGSWEQRRMEVSQRVFETHSNQGIMSRGRDSLTNKQEDYNSIRGGNNILNRAGDYRNY